MKFTNANLLLAAWLAVSVSAASLSNSKAPAMSLFGRSDMPLPSCKDGYCRMGCDQTASPGGGVPASDYKDGEPWCWLITNDVDSVNNKENHWIPCDENGSCDNVIGANCAYPDGGAGGCGV